MWNFAIRNTNNSKFIVLTKQKFSITKIPSNLFSCRLYLISNIWYALSLYSKSVVIFLIINYIKYKSLNRSKPSSVKVKSVISIVHLYEHKKKLIQFLVPATN